MKKTTTHCDQCDKRIDYRDIDYDYYEIGYTLQGPKDEDISVQFSNHSPTSYGSSSSPSDPLVIPKNICSKGCMTDYMISWANNLPEITDSRSGN